MRRAADFVRAFCAEHPDLTGTILSSVSTFDPLRSSEEKILVAENRRFRGISEEEIVNRYQTLLNTTPEMLLPLCDALEDLAHDKNLCIAGGSDLLESCGDEIRTTITL